MKRRDRASASATYYDSLRGLTSYGIALAVCGATNALRIETGQQLMERDEPSYASSYGFDESE